RMIRIWNDVIIRKGPVIRASTVSPNKIEVVGSSSGTHSGLFEVSDDRRTLVFTPETPYFPGHTVSVTLLPELPTLNGSALPRFPFNASGDLLIVDNRGNPIFWRRLSTQRPFDFKLLPDGRLVFIGSDHAFIMDSSYAYVDSFTTGNGYPLDMHEFQLLTNGHVLLMTYQPP